MGTCSASAASEARTIFSTVRAPHDPALTIGSLATTTAGIPSIVPRPVTTPSAGSPSAMALARTPSSTNDPPLEQQVDALAGGQLALAADLRQRPLFGNEGPSGRVVEGATSSIAPAPASGRRPPTCSGTSSP